MATESLWQLTAPQASLAVLDYLIATGSLTKRLIATGHLFGVSVLYQGSDISWPDELTLFALDMPKKLHARHVALTLDNVPVIIARSLSRLGCRTWHTIHHRDNRSLGLTLFEDHTAIKREPLHYCFIEAEHPLFALARQQDSQQTARYLARRSRFLLNNAPLSVCEVFLPALENFLPCVTP